MKVKLQHPSGPVKEVKAGFSWTVFFFGLFVPLIRGDLKWAAIMFGVSFLVGAITAGLGAFIPGLVFCFVYNKIYIKELLEKGYSTTNPTDDQIIQSYIN